MEPPAVTTNLTNGSERPRRQNSIADYLQIDPSSTFINNTARNAFDELPENFLDTVSPHPTTTHETTTSSSSIPITSMNITSEQSSSSYTGLLPSYRDKSSTLSTFSNSPAGLLSPLHLDRRQRNSHDFSNPGGYVKEEVDIDTGNPLIMQQQELERISQAETPPAVSNVELASNMIASLIGGESHGLQSDDAHSPGNYNNNSSSMVRQDMIKDEADDDAIAFNTRKVIYQKEDSDQLGSTRVQFQTSNQQLCRTAARCRKSSERNDPRGSAHASSSSTRRVYSTQDQNDPLNAEIDDDIYIDTKDLCRRIAFELKQHSIPQAIFAERILCRSQGTLSDLLRNPKPWNKLKSGRETFRRMYNWVRQPLDSRLAILDIKSENDDMNRVSGMSPPTPAQNVRLQRKSSSDPDNGPSSKRPRLVFTDIQKRTLQAIFKETQRPSREMQQTIAEHLRLDLSTVANFFMNARRRSRIGSVNDEPSPYQQERKESYELEARRQSPLQQPKFVRPITPPPECPPGQANGTNGDEVSHHPRLNQDVDREMSLYKDTPGINEMIVEREIEYTDMSQGAGENSNSSHASLNNESPNHDGSEKSDVAVIKEETPDDGEYDKQENVAKQGEAVKSN